MIDRDISFQIQDITSYRKDFKTVRALYDFACSERDFWIAQKNRVNEAGKKSHPALSVSNTFTQIINTIDSWEENIESWDDNQFNQQVQNLRQNQVRNIQQHWVWSGHPFIETFVQCLLEGSDTSATAFLDYVVKNSVSNINHFEHFKGAMLGYEFVNQESTIAKRRNGEKVALGHLRNQFADAKDELFTEVKQLREEHEGWSSKSRRESARLYRVNKYLGERRTREQNKSFNEKLTGWQEAITELEKTYEEKLKLKKPAEYWAQAATKYGRQGSLWSLAIVALVVFGLVYSREFFVTWLQGKELGVELKSLQGAILFAAMAAVYAFLIRVLSRLAFSSFHLMRDAEEREQLTYLYLSLSNESEVDKESREIVLQALFSRSETGLLAQEHGPTMPGIGEALKVVARGK